MIKDRYPQADALSQRGHWDDATRRAVLDRVHNVPEFKYFSGNALATLEALCALVIPQEHRPIDQRVPLAPWIDDLCVNKVEVFRYDNMPATDVAWNWGIEGINQTAQQTFEKDFIQLDSQQQQTVANVIRDGNPPGDVWQRMPAER